ncbi:SGM_5486 family transporter-associated protein [Streptomyces malaysiensis]|nr:SGM_5486 family transporter-associated protein [Streptomyces sp. DR7-3]
MPVLDENPPNGQKKLLIIFSVMLGITAIIAVIATLASP